MSINLNIYFQTEVLPKSAGKFQEVQCHNIFLTYTNDTFSEIFNTTNRSISRVPDQNGVSQA